MSRDPALVGIATAIAGMHKLDPALVCAVSEHESKWNPWAMRYEPGFLAKYEERLRVSQRFSVTEEYARAISYGLMHVIGETAREFGFTGEFLTELCDPHVGIEFGCRKLVKGIWNSHGVIAEALLAYNGGADGAYPGEVLALMPSYQT